MLPPRQAPLYTETNRVAAVAKRQRRRSALNLIHDVVQTIKKNLKVDWTEPHRDEIRAEIRAAVRRVLRRRGLREADFDPFIERFMQQAEAQYADWPLVA